MATGENWYYMRGNERFGPVPTAMLQNLLQSGAMQAQDLVWSEGMPQWAAAGTVIPGAGASAAVPMATAASAVPVSMGYYGPSGGMPPRAAEALQGCAAPTGDVGTWPLDDALVAQYEKTLNIRRKIIGCARMYQTLLLLTAIGSVFVVIGVIAAMSSARGNAQMTWAVFAFVGVIFLGITILYYFAAAATRKSKRWAPLTMLIIYCIGGVVQIVSMAVAGQQSTNAGGQVVIGVFGLFFSIIFAVVSARAYSAIPDYLAQPAWCQELAMRGEKKSGGFRIV